MQDMVSVLFPTCPCLAPNERNPVETRWVGKRDSAHQTQSLIVTLPCSPLYPESVAIINRILTPRWTKAERLFDNNNVGGEERARLSGKRGHCHCRCGGGPTIETKTSREDQQKKTITLITFALFGTETCSRVVAERGER